MHHHSESPRFLDPLHRGNPSMWMCTEECCGLRAGIAIVTGAGVWEKRANRVDNHHGKPLSLFVFKWRVYANVSTIHFLHRVWLGDEAAKSMHLAQTSDLSLISLP